MTLVYRALDLLSLRWSKEAKSLSDKWQI